MDPSRTDDEALLAARSPAEAGPAFAAFYARHEHLVAAFHQRRTGDAELAADLTAETFAQALASRGRFTAHGPDSAVRWLYGIAGNVLRRSRRDASTELRAMQRLRLDRPDLDDAQLTAITEAGADGAVLAALELLPEAQREVVRAFVLEGTGYDALAAARGVPAATVRKRVSRGLASLRRSLEDSR